MLTIKITKSQRQNKVFIPPKGTRETMKLVDPVFYSYLGFGLKAARLVTLGALEMEGSSGFLYRVGDDEGNAYAQLALPVLGCDSTEQRLLLNWEACCI